MAHESALDETDPQDRVQEDRISKIYSRVRMSDG
jgi:hypothetical protein